jgi:hypothetical protein
MHLKCALPFHNSRPTCTKYSCIFSSQGGFTAGWGVDNQILHCRSVLQLLVAYYWMHEGWQAKHLPRSCVSAAEPGSAYMLFVLAARQLRQSGSAAAVCRCPDLGPQTSSVQMKVYMGPAARVVCYLSDMSAGCAGLLEAHVAQARKPC